MPRTMTRSPLQVYLRQDQLDSLRSLSERKGVSLAELVRQGVDRLLLDTPLEADPLWDVIDLGRSGLRDMAAEHDRYLATAETDDDRYDSQDLR